MAAQHVRILACHMFDKLFVVGHLDHVLADMRCAARGREQHHHLDFRRINLAVALVRQRDELVCHLDEMMAVQLAVGGLAQAELFRPVMPIWELHVHASSGREPSWARYKTKRV